VRRPRLRPVRAQLCGEGVRGEGRAHIHTVRAGRKESQVANSADASTASRQNCSTCDWRVMRRRVSAAIEGTEEQRFTTLPSEEAALSAASACGGTRAPGAAMTAHSTCGSTSAAPRAKCSRVENAPPQPPARAGRSGRWRAARRRPLRKRTPGAGPRPGRSSLAADARK
jgi:hypothetical protein